MNSDSVACKNVTVCVLVVVMFNSGIEFTGLLLVLFLQLNGEALLFTVEISFQIRQILDVQQSLSACC